MMSIVTAALAVIESLLPLLGGAGNAVLIGKIIVALEQFLPIIVDAVPAVYQSIKNIIAALSSDPSTTQDQLVKLQALDKVADDMFEAAAKDVDPDAPVAS